MLGVLFVDDEPAILEGLQEALYRYRQQWALHFAPSGQEAQQVMDREPVDLLITDMRMPQMDGADLLAWTRTHHPDVTRVLLSGHADARDLNRALPYLHQSLAKPASAEQVRAVIERQLALQSLLPDAELRAVAGRLAQLPCMGGDFQALLGALSQADLPIGEIVTQLQRHPLLSARVLQLVNSAYYGLPGRIHSLQHAVSWLGLELVRGLATALHMASLSQGQQDTALQGIDAHARRSAELTGRLAEGRPEQAAAVTAALLHNLGRTLLHLAALEGVAPSADWQSRHAQLGAYLLGLWGLPLDIVQAVAYYAEPQRLGRALPLLAWVHLAHGLARQPSGEDLNVDYLSACGLGADLDAWREAAQELCS